MAAQDMNGTLKKLHLDMPFSTIGDEIITELTILAAISTKKLNNPPVQETTTDPKAT